MSDESRDHIGIGPAARILGVHRETVKKMARRGVFTTIQLPGLPLRLLRSDVERVARESVTPTKGGAA